LISEKVTQVWKALLPTCRSFGVDSAGNLIVVDDTKLRKIQGDSTSKLGELPHGCSKIMVKDDRYYIPHKEGISQFTSEGILNFAGVHPFS